MAPANCPDGRTLLPLVIDMPSVLGKVGRPKRNPDRVVTDKGYDDKSLHVLLRWLGIELVIPKRGSDDRAWPSGVGLSNSRSAGSIGYADYAFDETEDLNSTTPFSA